MADTTWATAVTSIRPNEIRVRGYRLDELMGRISFGEAVYLVLRGELPGASVGRLVEAMLVASIDHGVTPPSTLAVRNAATTGAPLNACIASGALAVNKHHGGAVEDCMHLLARGARTAQAGESTVAAARALIAEEKAAGRRLPGFGHRVHTDDPRSHRLLQLAGEADAAGPHVAVAEAIVRELASGRQGAAAQRRRRHRRAARRPRLPPRPRQRLLHPGADRGVDGAGAGGAPAREADAPDRSGRGRLRRGRPERAAEESVRKAAE